MAKTAKKQPRRKYGKDQRSEALDLYESDGLSAAAKATGIPKGTIATWVRRAGVKTVANTKTAAATETRVIDAAHRRATVISKSITLAETLLDQLATDIESGEPLSTKDKAVIFGIVADKHRAIAGMERDVENLNAVDAWLSHVTNGT